MTYAAPLLILVATMALAWFCCLRPMCNRGGCCAPGQDRSVDIEELRREIAELRRSSE